MSQLSPVTFHGDTIFCIDYQGQPYTPAKPIVENLGLSWGTQSVKFNANKGRWSVSIIETVAQDGRNRETLCIPVRKLPAFLASINPKKVRPELRPKIELYQAECDDALWDYWMKGRAERPATLTPFTQDDKTTVEDRKPLKSLVSVWSRMTGIPDTDLWPQVRAQFGIFRIDQIRKGQLPAALAWVQAKIDALPPAAPQTALPDVNDIFSLCPAPLEDSPLIGKVRKRIEKYMDFCHREQFGIARDLMGAFMPALTRRTGFSGEAIVLNLLLANLRELAAHPFPGTIFENTDVVNLSALLGRLVREAR